MPNNVKSMASIRPHIQAIALVNVKIRRMLFLTRVILEERDCPLELNQG